VILDLRYTRDLDALRTAVAEMTQLKVAFIVSSGPAIRAIRGARDIPVLFAISGDPVELGLAASLGRAGGNFTAVTFLSLEVAGKRVDLLKQAVPQLRRLAVLSNQRETYVASPPLPTSCSAAPRLRSYRSSSQPSSNWSST